VELGRIVVPISITRSGIVIDGYARLQIASELDIFCPWVVEDVGDDQIRSLARTLNLARRQLDSEQKRQLIAAELIEDDNAAKLGESRRSFNLIAWRATR
jgi:ParB-like chromosome segregation protein Spo0J